ncbi:MAG: FkbM family methyltransferase [Shimia sp.]|uniref:FkbM family methyltransferase n=1 Tax=Shimia sp. TaxID=1954381 RepID=UPI004059BFDB
MDVGAYSGCFSLFVAKLGFEVDAFELVPRTTERLKINVRLNGLQSKIGVHGFGVSNTTGEVDIQMPRDENFLGTGNSIDVKENKPLKATTRGKVRRLDDWWVEAERPQIDPIKLDVERHERQAIEGADEMITTCRPTMIVEINKQQLPDFREWADDRRYRILNCQGMNRILEPLP